MNVAYNATLTWVNPSLVTLEKQMEVPLFGDNPVEMGVNDSNKADVLRRITTDPVYPAKFAAAFPGLGEPVGWGQVIQAISSVSTVADFGQQQVRPVHPRQSHAHPG
jgi:cytochrome c peroxidase